jgi:hypothetical protein
MKNRKQISGILIGCLAIAAWLGVAGLSAAAGVANAIDNPQLTQKNAAVGLKKNPMKGGTLTKGALAGKKDIATGQASGKRKYSPVKIQGAAIGPKMNAGYAPQKPDGTLSPAQVTANSQVQQMKLQTNEERKDKYSAALSNVIKKDQDMQDSAVTLEK